MKDLYLIWCNPNSWFCRISDLLRYVVVKAEISLCHKIWRLFLFTAQPLTQSIKIYENISLVL